ncbi:MAG: hypothetical protein JWP63_1816 [Candidatus Solibacter sp.]|nr:hypothetical protein [Candidatus Solibacter sp.]
MQSAKTILKKDAVWSNDPPLQRKTDANGHELSSEKTIVVMPQKPKVRAATASSSEPGTEYWLP